MVKKTGATQRMNSFVRRNKSYFRQLLNSVNKFCCGASEKYAYIKILNFDNKIISTKQLNAYPCRVLHSFFLLYVNVNFGRR
jgi:uncharacterized pyridoxamine 5'-phosphate oxidase family protein